MRTHEMFGPSFRDPASGFPSNNVQKGPPDIRGFEQNPHIPEGHIFQVSFCRASFGSVKKTKEREQRLNRALTGKTKEVYGTGANQVCVLGEKHNPDLRAKIRCDAAIGRSLFVAQKRSFSSSKDSNHRLTLARRRRPARRRHLDAIEDLYW